MIDLTNHEYRFLLAVANFSPSTKSPRPTAAWLKRKLKLGPKCDITKTKNTLKKKGFLDERFKEPVLSKKGKCFLNRLSVPVRNKVAA